jgi:probable addiction module antidote protein
MPDKSSGPKLQPAAGLGDIAKHINCAFEGSNVELMRRAIGETIRLHNVSDIAMLAGLARPTIYRAFSDGAQHPSFETVVDVLRAMGLELRVMIRRGRRRGKIARRGMS